MPTLTQKPATTSIPVQLSATEFQQFILPHLSMPKRGPRCKLGYHRVFNLILWVLYTGMQWKCLPVPTDTHGKPAIHYTTVYKVFARWSDDGSLEEAFIASVRHLADHHQLDLNALRPRPHLRGATTVAGDPGGPRGKRRGTTPGHILDGQIGDGLIDVPGRGAIRLSDADGRLLRRARRGQRYPTGRQGGAGVPRPQHAGHPVDTASCPAYTKSAHTTLAHWRHAKPQGTSAFGSSSVRISCGLI
jgi:Putative transposase of IS4/5 family (DUF4096)